MNKTKPRPDVLLIGNGINRTYGLSSWDDLLSKIQTKKLTKEERECLNKIPYPLRPVIITGDNGSNKMKENAKDLCAFKPVDAEVKLIQDILTLSTDTILTTNYTYEIEKSKMGWEKLNLSYLSEYYGFEHKEVHRAWSDAEVNSQIYFELQKLI